MRLYAFVFDPAEIADFTRDGHLEDVFVDECHVDLVDGCEDDLESEEELSLDIYEPFEGWKIDKHLAELRWESWIRLGWLVGYCCAGPISEALGPEPEVDLWMGATN